MPATPRLVRRLTDRDMAIDVTVVVREIDTVATFVDMEVLQQHAWRLQANGVVRRPDSGVADDEWMPLIGPDTINPFAEIEAVQPVAVAFVVLESDEGQSADVDLPPDAIPLQHAHRQVDAAGRRRLEAVAVSFVLAGDVAGECVEAVGPPEAGSLILVERQRLSRQRLPGERLHGEVAVEDVVDLRPVFQEEPVPNTPVADAVPHDKIVRAVDRDPAVAAVPDGSPDDRAAAHRVADAMEVQAVPAEHILFTQVPEFGVADRPGRPAMIHRVPADFIRLGRFDHDVAAEIGHLATEIAGGLMPEL